MAVWRGDASLGVEAWLAATPAEDDGAPEVAILGDPKLDQESVARTIVLDQLAGRARSRSELADKLRTRKVPDDVAEPLLDRFADVGLIDDAAFARSWVEARAASRGLARRALAMELRHKGIDDEVACQVLDEIDPDQEADNARRLVQRKLRSMGRLDAATKARRLVAMLGRRGFSAGVAWGIVRDELGSSMPESES